jgi:hypothetical protein
LIPGGVLLERRNNQIIIRIDEMDTNDVIALILAIYGSLLATVLGVREFLKERRHIKVILEYIYFYEKVQMIITNTGRRPITITGIGMETYLEMKGEGHYVKLPFFAQGESGKSSVD